MSKYDNPYDAGDNDAYGSAATSRGRSAPAPAYSNLGGQYSTGSFYDETSNAKPVTIPMETISSQQQRELEAREAAVRKQAEELRIREAALVTNQKNWPPCYPLIHHDIANDIPVHLQTLMRVGFWTWLGIIICLLYNIIAVLAGWATSSVSYTAIGFTLAIIYFLIGVPVSYFIWYRPLYTALRKDGPVSFAIFFLCYLIHIAYCIFSFIGPRIFLFHTRPFTGLLITIDLFTSEHITVGVIFAVGTALYALEACLSIYVLQGVYRYFRGVPRG